MKLKFERCMRVNHSIENVNGIAEHVVRIYPPTSPYVHKTGRWPVSETETSLDAIWSGVFEARDSCEWFDADGIAVYSTDKEAFEAYCAELSADE
ncbi:hypothetical protein [Paenibacillus contaminans]|uniref:Uncharacterized protein n=1 Tax=Paenibacillus contaminans TaxID=450362 RepID=A0A329MIL0_9BACL|nr:hypothetical protein [Paenibacillus contaminans]RAV19502.1 hypothetical protein DQG23_21180 [Paenibacillus contaminans]